MSRVSKPVEALSEAMSIKYNNRVYEMTAKGADVIKLSYGEAYFDVPLFKFDDLPFPALYHYSHSRGIPPLREKIAAYYKNEYGLPVDPDRELIITAGSKIAIHMTFMSLLNPGDEVIVHEPAWVSYVEQVKLCYGKPVLVPHTEPVTALGKYVTSKTRIIVVNTPNNPRGSVVTKAELEYLHGLAKKHNLYLVSDEAYSEYLLEADEFTSVGAMDPKKEHTVVCNSLSKNYGISGWRIGYLITNPQLTSQILKVNQHLITCPATILEMYLAKHFDEIIKITRPQIRNLVKKRGEVAAMMKSMGIKCLPGDATFYFFVDITGSTLKSAEFCDRLLEEYKVSAIPGIGYGDTCDNFIRVSCGTESMDRIREGLKRFKELMDATKVRSTSRKAA